MNLPGLFARFVERAPLPVMIHGVLSYVFEAHVLDTLFACCAQRQHTGRLLYSTVLELMTAVVTRVEPSLRAAIRSREQELPVLPKAVYEKVAGLEPEVIAATLALTADEMEAILAELSSAPQPVVPGLRTLVLDGNHLGSVQHRLRPLRGIKLAALPGTCVLLLDQQRKLFKRAYLLENGHSSEREVLPQVLTDLHPSDLLLADRNFCLRAFAAGIEDRQAYFVFRQHLGNFPLVLSGERKFMGQTATGQVSEQAATYHTPSGERAARRITVELFHPTRDHATELHLVTNLPAERLDTVGVAEAYRKRWTIETGFQTMTVDLHCELNTLGYPPAALFAFCVAAMAFNAYSVARGALLTRYGETVIQHSFSNYYLIHELRKVWTGMRIAIDLPAWAAAFGPLTRTQFRELLLELAGNVDLRRYQKAPTKPHPPPKKGASQRQRHYHVAIQELLHPTDSK